MEYTIDERSYILNAGDILWHKSTPKHRVCNFIDEKSVARKFTFPPVLVHTIPKY